MMFIYYFTLVKFSDVLRIDGCIGMEIPIGEFRCLLAASRLSGRHLRAAPVVRVPFSHIYAELH